MSSSLDPYLSTGAVMFVMRGCQSEPDVGKAIFHQRKRRLSVCGLHRVVMFRGDEDTLLWFCEAKEPKYHIPGVRSLQCCREVGPDTSALVVEDNLFLHSGVSHI